MPAFLLRAEVDPDGAAPGTIYPVSDLSTEAILLISLHAGELPVDILEQLLAVAD